MTGTVKMDRARRNLLKLAGTMAAAIVGATVPARADHDDRGGDGGNSCFLRGTQVRTPDGYRAVEALSVGDKVAARFAGFAPIKAVDGFTLERIAGKWVGHARPVRVKRNALGENMPTQDLCLTAAHAVAIDGALVPVINLVNGTSIVFETAEGRDLLEFFHIELAHHDLLEVQGVACESLRRPGVDPCLPLLGFNGHRSELRSRVRSAMSVVVDRRQPLDLIRDTIEERGLAFVRAA